MNSTHGSVDAAVPRRAARVLLLDAVGRVLLIRYESQGRSFWITPGGAVDAGETDEAAAVRELYEELHIRADVAGPVHQTVGRFHHEGVFVENTDVFFVARIEAAEAVVYGTTSFEAECMREARWWTLEELAVTAEMVYPRDLPEVLERIGGQ